MSPTSNFDSGSTQADWDLILSQAEISNSPEHLRAALAQIAGQLVDANERNAALADAIVNSAEIIDELEQTKLKLAQAQEKAEQAARNTRLLTETVFERTHDAMLVLNADLSCMSANRHAFELFGLEMNSAFEGDVFSSLRENFNSSDSDDWVTDVNEQLETTASARCELNRKSAKYKAVWLEVSFSIFHLRDERHVLVIGHEISERKAFELELRRSRDFLTQTLNALPDLLCVRGADLNPVLANNAFNQISQNNPSGIGTVFNVAEHSDPIELEREKKRYLDGDHDDDELFCDHRGVNRIFSTRRSTFRDPVSGDPYFVSASRDITQQRKNEDRIRLLAGVFENTREGVVVLDLQGRICEANPEFSKLIGINGEQLLARSLDEFTTWDQQDFAELLSAAIGGKSFLGRVTLNQNDQLSTEEPSIYWGSLCVSQDETEVPRNLIAILSDITQIEQTQKRLHRQALHDNLTGLPNRRYFVEKMEELIEKSQNDQSRFGICFLDLDDFKIVNDTLGHEAGDQLLISVTDRLKQCVFRDCFLSRFGGDEFALLIPDSIHRGRAEVLTNEIVAALNEPFVIGEQQVFIGVSIGTTWFPEDAVGADQLLRHADLAMYHAKDEGKNTVRAFSPELSARIEVRQSMLNRLRKAIEDEQLFLAYQAKLSLDSNRVDGCEALVRWQDDGKMISPGDFIDVAERSGLILPLGDQVLSMAMGQARTWRDNGTFSGTIAVNLSPRQLADPEFMARFESLLKQHRCQPEWLELEITENAMMEDLGSSLRLMEQLNALGTRIAIDDFRHGLLVAQLPENVPGFDIENRSQLHSRYSG
ncbi:MAG: diguanylate cyclase [Pirellulaceae bacterium]